jgi:hypothetical protein
MPGFGVDLCIQDAGIRVAQKWPALSWRRMIENLVKRFDRLSAVEEVDEVCSTQLISLKWR